MTRTFEAEDDAAARWFVRLQAPDVEEREWIAFREWLEADPRNQLAYDALDELWLDLDGAEPRLEAPAKPPHRRIWLWAGAALAASLAAIMIGPSLVAPAFTDYATPRGARRAVTLADGTIVRMNGGSHLQVRLDRRRRDIRFLTGEASFEVAHDAARPFVIQAGDREVRDIGTQFNLLRFGGLLRVTVRQGLVAVTPKASGAAPVVRLAAGQELEHREGQAQSQVRVVVPDTAFAWQQGVLLYNERPLEDVAHDLSRYLGRPVTVDPGARAIRFTGALRTDDGSDLVATLESLAPVKAMDSDGSVRLLPRGD